MPGSCGRWPNDNQQHKTTARTNKHRIGCRDLLTSPARPYGRFNILQRMAHRPPHRSVDIPRVTFG